MEKKLMLSLVTTLTRQKAPMLFFSFCPPTPPPQGLDHRLQLGL